jgi:hypothetical protein
MFSSEGHDIVQRRRYRCRQRLARLSTGYLTLIMIELRVV